MNKLISNIKKQKIVIFLVIIIIFLAGSVGLLLFKKDKKSGSNMQNNQKTEVQNGPSELSLTDNSQTSQQSLSDIKKDPEYQHPKHISYTELFRHSDRYEGQYVGFTGEVIQVLGSPGDWNLRVNVTKKGDSYYSYYDDTVLVQSTEQKRVLENDIIKFTGLSLGTTTYQSVLGQDITVPFLMIYESKLVGRDNN